MAKIELVCLGGQDDKDKVTNALIIDGDIYVLGCGIQTPSAVTLGIKKIIADYSFLIDNKQKIKGVFIPTPNYNSYGGLEFLLKQLPNIPIYTSTLGQQIINNFLERKAFNKFGHNNNNHAELRTKFNVNAVMPLKPFKVGNVEICAFRTASFMPQSLMFAFKTNSGSIIYVDQFIVPTRVNNALYDLLNEVNAFTKGNNLILITSIGENINNAGFTSPKYSVASFFENCVLDAPNRAIFAIEEEDIYKLLRLAGIADLKTIPFYIYSGSLARTFGFMQQTKIAAFPHLIYISEAQINTIERGIIVVSGDKQSLFSKLQKIVMGEDQRMSFKPTDTFIWSILTQNGYEKAEANLFDSLNRAGVERVWKLPKDIIQLSQSQEDHKFLINVLKPKFIIPTNGLYMDLVKYKQLASATVTPLQNVIILSNGQFAKFDNGKFIDAKQHMKVCEQYVGSAGLYDAGASGLFECEQMADSGCVLASLLIDKQTKEIKHFNYNIVGVINQADEKNQPIVAEINTYLNTIMTDMLKEIKPGTGLSRDQQDYFKKQIVKQYEKKFGKRPLTLLTIIYTDQLNKNK